MGKLWWLILFLFILWAFAIKFVYKANGEESGYISFSEYFIPARTHFIALYNDLGTRLTPRLREPYIEATKEQTPRDYLREIAGEDFELKDRIINAESGWKIYARNSLSTASGLAQYLDSTFLKYCVGIYKFAESLKDKNDPYIQLKCFNKMVDDGGISHWWPSQIYWDI